jgi:hypothetical protein
MREETSICPYIFSRGAWLVSLAAAFTLRFLCIHFDRMYIKYILPCYIHHHLTID